MPRLLEDFVRALDANGDPVSGARLSVFRAGTTTPVTTYTDQARTVANSAPVISDAAGAFGPVYVADGGYKVQITNASGVQVPGSPWDNVVVSDGQTAGLFQSRAEAAAAFIPTSVTRVLTLDDGGAWRAVASQPAHQGRFQSADLRWWVLVSTPITPQMFGAVGDGVTNDTVAFTRAFDFLKAAKVPKITGNMLRVPCGEYLVDGGFDVIPDVSGGPTVEPFRLRVFGDGRGQSTIRVADDMATPLFTCAPTPTVKQGEMTFDDIKIDGNGKTGTGFLFNHMIKVAMRRVHVENFIGMVIDAKELWDCHFEDCLLEGCGDFDLGLPNVRLSNRDPADADTSCNNLVFMNFHVENHRHSAFEIFDGSRRISFVRLKCHHQPGNYPASAVNHMILDARNVAEPGRDVQFTACDLSTAAGSGIYIDNTGGGAGTGFRGVEVNGGSINGATRYGIEIRKCAGVTISSVAIRFPQLGAVSVHTDAHRVQGRIGDIDYEHGAFPFVPLRVATGASDVTNLRRQTISGGTITAMMDACLLDVEGGEAGTDDLDLIRGGRDGQVITLYTEFGDNDVRVRDKTEAGVVSGANIALASATFTLANPRARLVLRYEQAFEGGTWVEISRRAG